MAYEYTPFHCSKDRKMCRDVQWQGTDRFTGNGPDLAFILKCNMHTTRATGTARVA
jgi:hypothetical protein